MTQWIDEAAHLALRLLAQILSKMAPEKALAIGKILGRIAFYLSSRRSVAYADLKAALGNQLTEKERWRVIREHYGHLGEMLVEILRFPLLDRAAVEGIFSEDHPERVRDVFEGKRGAILLSAHLGNWEFAQMALGILHQTMHVLARDQKWVRVNEFLNQLRESHGSVAVGRGMGVRHLMKCLRRNEWIGFLGDQDAGKSEGLILPFFGRKTTIPTGAFELAARTGVPLFPSLIVRTGGLNHRFHYEDKIECEDGENRAASIERGVRKYVSLLEDYIRRYPSQWLWESKRWKYTWTKRLLILSDGKAGHIKQSEALADQFRAIQTQYGRPGMEYPTKTLLVRYKSSWHKKLFSLFALCFIPFAQGRLRWLGFFFKPESQKALAEASADFVISAGSSLAPLNLILARDSRAKSIVLMNPSFPFNFFRYDLAVIPFHDQGRVPEKTLRTLLTPSAFEEEALSRAAEKLKSRLRQPERVKFGVFLGGPTRNFRMELSDIEKLFTSLEKLSKRCGDYLVTTSRRTPEFISRFLKTKVARDPSCQLLVVANEHNPPETTGGMVSLADVLMVTEDSISMISEAVSAGKKVIVITLGSNGLPAKHARFKKLLEEKSAITLAKPHELIAKYDAVEKQQVQEIAKREREALQRRLQEIL